MTSENGSNRTFGTPTRARARATGNAPQRNVPLPSSRTTAPGDLSAHARATDDPGRKYLTAEQEQIVRAAARAGGRQDKAARRAGVKRWRVAAWCKATGTPWAQLKQEATLERVDARLRNLIAALPPERRARFEAKLPAPRNQDATTAPSTSKNTTSSGH